MIEMMLIVGLMGSWRDFTRKAEERNSGQVRHSFIGKQAAKRYPDRQV